MSVNCPKCGNSISPKQETIKGTDVLIFMCPNKCVLSVVNDMSKINKNIETLLSRLK